MRFNTKSTVVLLPVLASAQSFVTVPVVINGYTTNIAIPAYSGQSVIEATVTLAVATDNPGVIYGTAVAAPPSPPPPQDTQPPSTPTIVPVNTALAETPAALPLATNAPEALGQPYGVPVTPAVIVQPAPTGEAGGSGGSQTISTTNAAGNTVPLVVPVAPSAQGPTTYTTTSNGNPVVIVAGVPAATQAAGSVASGVGSTIAGAASTATAAVGSAAASASDAATSAAGAASSAVSSIESEASAAASSIASGASAAASSAASEASAAASSASEAVNSASAAASSAIASASASASNAIGSATSSLATVTRGPSASPTAPVPPASNHAPDVRIPGAMIVMSCVLTVALAWVLSA